MQYLGSTKKDDPDGYLGSGKYWLLHLKKHGNNVSTEILSRCKNKEEITVCGLFFSKLFDVVESPYWANLRPEAGEGWSGPCPEETKQKISKKMKGMKRKPFTEEHKTKLRLARAKQKYSAETRNKMSASAYKRWNSIDA
jgi:hypothetical protein